MATTQVQRHADDRPRRPAAAAGCPWPWSRGCSSSWCCLIVVVLLVVKITRGTDHGRPPTGGAGPSGGRARRPPRPGAVFDAVGAPQAPTAGPWRCCRGSPPWSSGARPAVVYVGAEFCPYCAAERWALVVALEPLRDLHPPGGHLVVRPSRSSRDADLHASTAPPTGAATWPSSAVEEYGDRPSTTAPAGFPLPAPPHPAANGRLIRRYDTGALRARHGTLPFVDVANRLVVSGAGIGFSPGVLQGRSMAQIAGDLSDPTSADTQAVLGAANMLSAAICAATGGSPTAVCDVPGRARPERAASGCLSLGR